MNSRALTIAILAVVIFTVLYFYWEDIPVLNTLVSLYILPPLWNLRTLITNYANSSVLSNPTGWFLGSIGGIVASLTAVSKIWGKLNAKKEELTSTVKSLQSQASNAVENVQGKLTSAEEQIAQLTNTNTNLTSTVDTLQTQVKDIPDLIQQKEDLQRQLDTKSATIDDLHALIEEMKGKVQIVPYVK